MRIFNRIINGFIYVGLCGGAALGAVFVFELIFGANQPFLQRVVVGVLAVLGFLAGALGTGEREAEKSGEDEAN